MGKHSQPHAFRGFTIMELLITIVIIGILVGLVGVSYNSITNKTRQKALENTLLDSAGKVKAYIAKNNQMPADLQAAGVGVEPGVTLTLTPSIYPEFCVLATKGVATLSISSSSGTIQQGGCLSPNIQTITKASCPTELTQVKDARDNNSYYIKKLGNDCWMLTNLAYAGAGNNTYSDTVALSVGTAMTYTEAKYYIPTGANPTTDPTPPSTDTTGGGSGAGRQYGYLYNWCAAMGGQNTAACANATTPTPIPTTNICPAGWRLPTGGAGGEFEVMNNIVYAGKTDSDSSITGAPGLFQRSGSWYGSFLYQGSDGNYWSSTQYSATSAHNLNFASSTVYPANNSSSVKSGGRAVRCIAE